MFKEEKISETDGSSPDVEDGDGVGEKDTKGTKRTKSPKETKLKGQQSSEISPLLDLTTLYPMALSRCPAQEPSSATTGTSG